jgi:tetratricopeptide (TPR) repeat protein
MRLKDISFYIIICLIIIGLSLRIYENENGGPVFALGLIGVFFYFTAKLVKQLFSIRLDKSKVTLQVLVIFMPVILFAKYLYFSFSDYPGLIIVPFFIFSSLFYLIKEKHKDIKLTVASILFLALSIPMFGFNFNKAPRNFVPKTWYDRYNVSEPVTFKFPHNFEHAETEKMSIQAFDFMKAKRYDDAIELYKVALQSEPDNLSLLFGLSDAYSRTNQLEQAILVLDMAINIDSTFSPFYNNRGLLYYKLYRNDDARADYEKAIQLDSTQFTHYANFALVLFANNEVRSACDAVLKAESLGLDISREKFLKSLKSKKCK